MDKGFLKIDGFKIIEDRFDKETSKYYEGVFAQGNGYFHVRGSFEEGLLDAPQDELYTRTMKSVTTEVQRHPLSKQGTFLPLIMGKHPFLGEVIINLPFFMGVKIISEDEKLDMLHSEIKDYSRSLNMKNGELTRKFIWKTEKGAEIQIEFSRFVSSQEEKLFVQKVKIRAKKGKPYIKVSSGIDGSVTTNGYCHFTKILPRIEDEKIKMTVETDMGQSVSVMSWNCLTGIDAKCIEDVSEKTVQIIYEGELKEEVEFTKYTAIGCSRDRTMEYEKEVESCLASAEKRTYEELLAENSEVWEYRWKEADIRIVGCQKLQDGLRFAIYHLLRCSGKEEDRIQICAKGFAGEAYYGRYFWDSEMYLLPFYLYTDPISAKSLVGYRYHTLSGAKENAKRYHSKGARYPWQSGVTGTEQCSLWEYADNEIHITADVVFGIMHYCYASGDIEFLFEKGIEILLETARFWSDRVDQDKNGKYHLLNVMGPDEYSPMTKDNSFTNYMVRFSLESTLYTMKLLKEKSSERYRDIIEKMEITQRELELFQEISSSLEMAYDKKRDLYLQSADFEEFAEIDLDSIWDDKKRAFGHYISREKIYRSRCIKQADVIALMSLFPKEFTEHQVQTAYEYYKPMTTHDSSLSPAVHALVANRLGMNQEVSEFLDKTLAVDMELARKGAEDGIHIANCGALWQMVIQGFLGMRPAYQGEELCVVPNLPNFIQSIETRLTWKGRKYQVYANEKEVSIRKLPVKVKGFLFDLDGVLTDTAEYHYLAWKKLSEELGLFFNRSVNERLKGVSREQSFEIILEVNGVKDQIMDKQKSEYIARKNRYYREFIQQITPKDILSGIYDFLKEAKDLGIRLAVASASKNAGVVLDNLGLTRMFDYIADASKIKYTKPDSEVFVDCMRHLGLQSWECVAFEDAAAGIEAIRSACITSVGIGEGTKEARPDIYLQNTQKLSVSLIDTFLQSR